MPIRRKELTPAVIAGVLSFIAGNSIELGFGRGIQVATGIAVGVVTGTIVYFVLRHRAG